jgi:hypothetical protein
VARLLGSAISDFTTITTSQGWPFDFTDEIGQTCRRIFYAVKDFEIRADLVYCVSEVGITHNRWRVMQIAADLISEHKQLGEAIPIVEKLSRLHRLQALNGYLKLSNLDPSLRALFEKKDKFLEGW